MMAHLCRTIPRKRELQIELYVNNTKGIISQNLWSQNMFGRPYKTDSSRKLFQIQWQTLSTNTPNSYGKKNSILYDHLASKYEIDCFWLAQVSGSGENWCSIKTCRCWWQFSYQQSMGDSDLDMWKVVQFGRGLSGKYIKPVGLFFLFLG